MIKTKDLIKEVRGLYKDYDPKKHKDYKYYCLDTGVMIYNGVEFGGGSIDEDFISDTKDSIYWNTPSGKMTFLPEGSTMQTFIDIFERKVGEKISNIKVHQFMGMGEWEHYIYKDGKILQNAFYKAGWSSIELLVSLEGIDEITSDIMRNTSDLFLYNILDDTEPLMSKIIPIDGGKLEIQCSRIQSDIIRFKE